MNRFIRRNLVRPMPFFDEVDRAIKCVLKKDWHLVDEELYFINADNNKQKLLPVLKMWANGWQAVQDKCIGDIKLINVECFNLVAWVLCNFNTVSHELMTDVTNSQLDLKTHFGQLTYNERDKLISILKAEQIRMYIKLAISN